MTNLSSHLCECGCGKSTTLAVKTDSRKGHIKGQPLKFLPGHASNNGPAKSNVGLVTPEFDAISIMRTRSLPDQAAAECLDGRLRALERDYRRSFVARGLILVEMEERQLWKLLRDSETGQAYTSLEDWICTAATYSRSDCMAAKEAVKKLKDVPTEQLLEVPRCNIGSLLMLTAKDRAKGAVKIGDRSVSVIEAAQSLPEKSFTKAVSEKWPELHIEERRTIHLNPVSSAKTVIDEAIEMAYVLEELTTREAVIECWAISYMAENRPRYEEVTRGKESA